MSVAIVLGSPTCLMCTVDMVIPRVNEEGKRRKVCMCIHEQFCA